MHAAKLPSAQGMSYEEFLDWCDEDTLAEWVDGEVIMASPASAVHQTLVGFLLKILDTYAEQRELGQVIAAPFQMKTGPELPGRDPTCCSSPGRISDASRACTWTAPRTSRSRSFHLEAACGIEERSSPSTRWAGFGSTGSSIPTSGGPISGTDQNPAIHLYTDDQARPEARSARSGAGQPAHRGDACVSPTRQFVKQR